MLGRPCLTSVPKRTLKRGFPESFRTVCATSDAAYNYPMAIIHKCDVCKKPIGSRPISVGRNGIFDSVEFCKTHAAPILKVLKKYKIAPSA
jgi:hypothetical protein